MTIAAARAMALRLMDKHGLHEMGYTLTIHRGYRTLLGCCTIDIRRVDRPARKRIVLSARFIESNGRRRVRNLVLHEIAHALVKWRVPPAPMHGRDFRRKAASIGVTGEFLW